MLNKLQHWRICIEMKKPNDHAEPTKVEEKTHTNLDSRKRQTQNHKDIRLYQH